MTPTIFGLTACFFYISASLLRLVQLRQKAKENLAGNTTHLRPLLLILVIAGVVSHSFSVYGEMFTESGINLRLQVMGSLIALAMALIILINSFRLSVDNLFLVVLPLAIVAIWSSHFGHNFYVSRTNLSTGILSHIIFSVLAYSIITVAACQALLLFIQDRGLKHFSLTLVNSFPPLMAMESLLFQFLSVGLALLTLSIVTGFIFLEDTSIKGLIHHTVITIMAWLTFAGVVWGRYQYGWRGGKAAKWTLTGFALLLLGYFGSKLVIEILLQP